MIPVTSKMTRKELETFLMLTDQPQQERVGMFGWLGRRIDKRLVRFLNYFLSFVVTVSVNF